jgi:hypothetical protein
MKLIKNSTELIDMEMIGLKNFQYYLNSSGCNSMGSNRPPPAQSSANTASKTAVAAAASLNSQASMVNESCAIDLELIINQNGITYEQLQSIIEQLLNENNYHMEHLRHLREELPSIN